MKKLTLPALLTSAALAFLLLTAMATPSVSVGFSPEGSALQLVLKTISDAQQSIRLMGYSFTSPEVVKGLIAAKRRGVDVKVVLDDRGNHGKSSVAAISLLVNAGIPVRLDSHYKIQHDKVIVTDARNVETGSFNFTRSADRYNSENALLLRDMPGVASQYLAHWQSRWARGTAAKSRY